MKYKILVAEDELIERMVLCKTLCKHLGELCDIFESKNGREALEVYDREQPQIAILDIEMPGINGLEVARKTRESGRDCAIMFLTGFDKFSYAKQAISIRAPEYLLKPYAENQPRNYPTSLGGERFAELVKERTDGKIVIQVKYAGEYGTDEEVVNQLQFGGIDFARISLAVIADEVPVLNVLQLPFLYQDSAHMWRVLDGEIGSDLLDTFVDAEVVGLSWDDAGARSFYSISPIRNLSDLKGRTVRVQNSQMAKDMVTCLGAKPVYVDHNDVQYAFETHKIDTAENNWLVYQYLEPEEKKEFQQAVTPLYEKYCADYMDFVQAIQAQKEA